MKQLLLNFLLLLYIPSLGGAWGGFLSADELFRAYRYEGFKNLPPCNDGDIVFIGNSITNMFNWYEAFGSRQNIHGRGTSGGYTQEILDNLQYMISGTPSKVFLMIGTNDLGTQGDFYLPEPTAQRIITILKRIRNEAPTASVYYESILPSTVGIRTQQKTEQTNAIVRKWISKQKDKKLTYIDLYSLFVNKEGYLSNADMDADALSFDGLHLSQKGYRLWTKAIEKYVGYPTVLPADHPNSWGGAGRSVGMRYSYFDALPTTESDILFFGDDLVHNVEWHELLNTPHIKDRAAGWGKNSLSLNTLRGSLPLSLAGRPAPRAICLLAGMTDVCSQTPLYDVFRTYQSVIDSIQTLAPGTPIYLLNLPPEANTQTVLNTRIKEFNYFLNKIVSEGSNLHLVDIHTPMMIDADTRNENLFLRPDEHFPNSKGNQIIAKKIAAVLGLLQ